MLFNSIDFAVFLPLVFILYWMIQGRKLWMQNLLVIVASYVFYGWWDWRFLLLIATSTAVDYLVGLRLGKENLKTRRKALLLTSIGVNLGLLGFFKYYGFFVDSFIEAFSFFGIRLETGTLNIVLPVGISFYTFQTMSYTIDVYKRKLEPTRDLFAFAAFVSFFPQLVAGPIERATHLLSQFTVKRKFDREKASDGLRQMLWGFFKKAVIADSCGIYVDMAFGNTADYSGSSLVIGVVLFAFQVYADFSGYSDIAIGASRLFGFDLRKNFAFPFFARDIAEFWRRWHISLTTWFRDYVYIPLGGSRKGNAAKIRNTFIIFVISGLWHGASWTFVIWGALNAVFFLPLLLSKTNRVHTDTVAEGRLFPNIKESLQMLVTFLMFDFGLLFFRSGNMKHSIEYLSGILSPSIWSVPEIFPRTIFLLLGIFMMVEWMGRERDYAIAGLSRFGLPVRWLVYSVILFGLGMFMKTSETPFVYFQF